MPLTANIPDLTEDLTVIINEGTDHAAKFTVPKTLLTEKSEFFKAACRNEWKESTSRVIRLPDVDVDAFRSYVFWIHREKIAVRDGEYLDEDSKHTFAERGARGGAIHTSLAKLWILADRLADVHLRNAVIDELVSGLAMNFDGEDKISLFPPELTTHVWTSTTAGRSLRKLALDNYVGHVWAREVRTSLDEFPAAFLKDFMLRAMEEFEAGHHPVRSPEEMVKEYGQCYYHEHDEQCPPCQPEQEEKTED